MISERVSITYKKDRLYINDVMYTNKVIRYISKKLHKIFEMDLPCDIIILRRLTKPVSCNTKTPYLVTT